MELYTQLIKQAAKSSAQLMQGISERLDFFENSIQLNADKIANVDWLAANILESNEYKQMFDELILFKDRPVLYIVELVNDIDHGLLLNAITAYTQQDNKRAFPAFWGKRVNNAGHKILYVGKVVRDFHGRVMQHMGYHRSDRTQGLQLAHWAAAIGANIKISYSVFEPKEANLMPTLEYQLAEQLKPLLGKHK